MKANMPDKISRRALLTLGATGAAVVTGSLITRSSIMGSGVTEHVYSNSADGKNGSAAGIRRIAEEVVQEHVQPITEQLAEKASKSRLDDICMNVMDFGAKGDGVFDNTDVVRSALENSINKILYFPAGEYNFTRGNILIDNINRKNGNRIHIKGEMGTKFIYTKEDKTRTAYVQVSEANSMFDIVNFDTVIFENVELVGNTTYENVTGDNADYNDYFGAVWGVKVRKNNHVYFNGVDVHGFNYRGISINDHFDTEADLSENVSIYDCKGHHNRGSGFWINNVDRLFISDSEFFDDGMKGTIATGYGVACSTGVNHTFVENCYFHHSWGKGLDSHGFGNLTVRSCTFEEMGKACIGWGYSSKYVDECHIVIENNTFISGLTAEGEQWIRELHQANASNGFYNRQGMLHCYGNAKRNAVIEIKNNSFLGCYNGWDVPVEPGNDTISDNRIIMLGADDDTGAKGFSQVVIQGNLIRADKYHPYSIGDSRGAEMIYLGKNVTEASITGNQIMKKTEYRMANGRPGCVVRSYYNKTDAMLKIFFYHNSVHLKEGYLFQVVKSCVSLRIANNDIEVATLDNVRNETNPFFNELEKYGLRRANTEFYNNKLLLANRKLSFSGVKLIPFANEGPYAHASYMNSFIDYAPTDRKRVHITRTGIVAGGTVGYIYLDNVGLFDVHVTLSENIYANSMTTSEAKMSIGKTALTISSTFHKDLESDRFDLDGNIVEYGNIRLLELRIKAKTVLPSDVLIDVSYTTRAYASFGILSFSKDRITSF